MIGGSVFPHNRIHKATWVSPDQVTENQIDHIGINKMFRRSLQDVRVKRGTDVGSDHHLVTARLKLKLRRNDVDQERGKVRYSMDYLKDQKTAQEYKVALSNRFKVLQELYDENQGVNIDRHWSHIKEAVNTTCEEVLDRRKNTTDTGFQRKRLGRYGSEKTRRGQSTAAAEGQQKQRPIKSTQQQI